MHGWRPTTTFATTFVTIMQHETAVWQLQNEMKEAASAHEALVLDLREQHAAQCASMERHATEKHADIMSRLQVLAT